MATGKPEKLGNVWTASALIRYIDQTNFKWVTVDTCIDTPNAIAATYVKASKKHPGKTLWVHSQTKGKYIP